MESSDELYAAAASLGMDLQLFCSYSFEMTDEIILSCIGHATKSSRGIYPRMPESQTLAESFLTTFPSINPLSSHAILSSAGVFIKFLEWSHEHRVRAVQKYHVPDESVALLSTFCRYGEREDCKSGTTDCSSSVSSAPDSIKCLTKSVSEMRKRKYTSSVLNGDMPMDDVFHFEPLKLFIEGRETPTKMSKPYNSWLSEGPDIFYEVGNSSVSFEDKLFTRKLGSKINMKTTPSRVSKPCDFQMSKGHVMSEEKENQPVLGNDALFSQNQRLDTATMIKFDGSNSNCSGNLRKDFIGEVIDIDDSCPSVEHSSIANSLDFSHLLAEMERDPAVRYSRTARKLSFGNSSLPTFPTAAEISCDSDALISKGENRQNSGEQIFQHSDKGLNNKGVFLEQKDLLQEDTLPKAVRNSHSFLEKDIPHYGGTPLSNAIRFSEPHQGSPWTIEFLNRIREKSRLRQQSLPQDLSVPCFGYSGNISKATKRKSPSILDFYKYQRGSTPNKIMEQKRQKHSLQPSCSSKNEKSLPSFIPAVTPIDKRARQVCLVNYSLVNDE